MKPKHRKAGKSAPKRPVALQRSRNGERKPGGITGKGFMPGQSGNPSGKRAGTVSPTAALRRALTRADAELIAQRVIALARRGDAQALKLLFDRLDRPLTGPLALAVAQASASGDVAPAAVSECRVQIILRTITGATATERRYRLTRTT